MGVKISQFVAPPQLVEVEEGRGFTVRALDLTALAQLINDHREDMVALYDAGSATPPRLQEFVSRAPLVVRDVIAAGADVTDPEEIVACGRLPVTVQIDALFTIWNLTVPNPKKLEAVLSAVNDAILAARRQGSPNVNPENPSPTTDSDASKNPLPQQ